MNVSYREECSKCHGELKMEYREEEREGGMIGTYDAIMGYEVNVYEICEYVCRCGSSRKFLDQKLVRTERRFDDGSVEKKDWS